MVIYDKEKGKFYYVTKKGEYRIYSLGFQPYYKIDKQRIYLSETQSKVLGDMVKSLNAIKNYNDS